MSERVLSREDVLGGLAGRRAPMVVQAIRSRTAARVARSRRALSGYPADAGSASREQDFLAALAAGRDLPRKPTIRDLERYAEDWAPLVPADPGLRLAVARRLAAEEPLPRDRVPRLRAAFGLDDLDADGLYAERLGMLDRLRWRRARLAERLERMPPFWTAFALTLTECVGAGILALPVAMAGIGPIGAVVLLAIFGAVNIITVAAVAEAITRTGPMRYGIAYFDHLVADHLGTLGARMLGVALFALNGAVLPVTLIGFGTILESATGVGAVVWAAVLFAVNLELLRRERMDATIASALVIGAVNIGLILALAAVALLHLQPGNFEQVNVPLLDGRPVDTEVLALIFGVVLLAFFGHTSAANSAKVVLERDPSGRALLWGNVAALAAAAVLYSLTALAFTGALDRSALEGSDGTVLEPLAEVAGPAVHVLGSAFAVLAVGLGSVYACLGLYNQVLELRPQSDRRLRFAVGAAAPAALFALVLWLMATGQDSFTAPLGYAGALTAPLVGGLFPMLLVVAARRRGELVPGTAPRFVGHTLTAALVGGLFAAAVLVHGLVIWDAPLLQAAALSVAAGMVAVAILAWRRGGFRARSVVELRREPERDLGVVGVTVAGEGVTAPVELDGRPAETGPFEGFSRVRSVTVRVPRGAPAETAVWAHHVTSDGDSVPLPADVEVSDGTVSIALRQAP
jgi:amino acid permease